MADVTSRGKADSVTSRHKGEEVNDEVQYAWQDAPAKLSNNLGQDTKIAEKEEEKLVKEGLTEEFHGKSDDFTRFGTLGELSQRGMGSWTGEQPMFAYIVAVLLWIGQTMLATRLAFQDGVRTRR